jgi:hypothetical protein
VQIEVGRADREQDAAFNNGDVRTMVDNLMRYPSNVTLLRIGYEAVIRRSPSSRDTLRARLGGEQATEELVDAAVAVAAAGARIYGDERRKSALLERLVHSLVASRSGAETTRETRVHLTVNPHSGESMTGRKDVVRNSNPFEVYECKFGGGIEQFELNELGDVYLTAEAEGTDARPCIATMATMTQLQTRIGQRGLVLHPKLYFAGLTDLPRLAQTYPTQQIA